MPKTVTMPESLTAENGAKALLIGEFHSSIELNNPDHCGCGRCDCCLEGLDEDPTYILKIPVSWTTIKEIYAMAVKHLASENLTDTPQPVRESAESEHE